MPSNMIAKEARHIRSTVTCATAAESSSLLPFIQLRSRFAKRGASAYSCAPLKARLRLLRLRPLMPLSPPPLRPPRLLRPPEPTEPLLLPLPAVLSTRLPWVLADDFNREAQESFMRRLRRALLEDEERRTMGRRDRDEGTGDEVAPCRSFRPALLLLSPPLLFLSVLPLLKMVAIELCRFVLLWRAPLLTEYSP